MGIEVIVIGAGVFGLSTARQLARNGKSVVLVDRLGSGHPATSSTGASRSIRVAYEVPFYADLAMEAIESWRQLEAETDSRILHLTGQVDLGPIRKLQSLLRTTRAAGADVDLIEASEVRRQFPELRLALSEVAMVQKSAGTVLADVGMLALMRSAQKAGVIYLAPERAIAVEPGATVKVITDRRVLEAGQVVVAAGPWAKDLLDRIGIVLPLAPAVAQVTFLDAPGLVDRPGIAEWSIGDAPGFYGHPVPGIGYKIAFDAGAAGWDPDVQEWAPDPEEERRALAWLAGRMPSVPPRVYRTQRHPWTMTPDVDFIVDRQDNLVVAVGCAGHAFKFGPALGRFVADIVQGEQAPPLTRLGRAALLNASAPSPSLPISR